MKRKSVIRQLLLDDPCSIDSMGINEEQGRLLDELSNLKEEINNKFADDEVALNLFKKFRDTLDDLCFEDLCGYFERGLRFGVKFGMELAEE